MVAPANPELEGWELRQGLYFLAESSRAVRHFNFGEDIIPGGTDGGEAGLRGHLAAQARVRGEGQGLSEKGVIIVGNEPGFAVADDEFRSAGGSDDRGNAGGESFEDDVAEGIGSRRKNEDVKISVGAGEGLAAEHASKLSVPQIPSQFIALPTVTDDTDFEIRHAVSDQIAFDVRQKMDILFDRKSPDTADPQSGAGMGSFCGIEQHGIDTAPHEEAGATGRALDE